MPDDTAPKPRQAIRRFDVFAEVNRLDALADGRPADEAKGHGIWLAKVVAGRRFGRKSDPPDRQRPRQDGDAAPTDRPATKFKHAGDDLQTDETFDREIVDRMGEPFYRDVFAPAIKAAVDQGQKYEQFRDSIRSTWKPARSK